MSKVKAEIVSGVNLGSGTVFVPGMEADLSAVITQKEINHLTKQGAIVGDWTVTKSTAQAEKEAEQKAAADAKAKAEADEKAKADKEAADKAAADKAAKDADAKAKAEAEATAKNPK